MTDMGSGGGAWGFSMAHQHWLIIPQNYYETPSETLTFIDIMFKNINKFLTEPLQIGESIGKNIVKGVSDIIQFTESVSLAKTIVKQISDNLSMVDRAFIGGHLEIDNVDFTDVINRAITKVIQVSDNIIINEFMGKNIPKHISDGVTFVDSEINTVYRNFTNSVIDALSTGDTISKNIGKIIQETPGFIDKIGESIYKMVLDGVTFTEVLNKLQTSILLEQSRNINPKSNNDIISEGQVESI